MESVKCALDGTRQSLASALKEAEYFGDLLDLGKKQTLHLRLLTEELLSMVNNMLEIREGRFWLEQDEARHQFLLHLTAKTTAPLGETARHRLLDTSTSGTNAFYQGVSGKLRMAMDWLTSGSAETAMAPRSIRSGFVASPDTLEWSLDQYRQGLQREEKAQQWDELERSVLSCLSDDIRVGLRSSEISITITKKAE